MDTAQFTLKQGTHTLGHSFTIKVNTETTCCNVELNPKGLLNANLFLSMLPDGINDVCQCFTSHYWKCAAAACSLNLTLMMISTYSHKALQWEPQALIPLKFLPLNGRVSCVSSAGYTVLAKLELLTSEPDLHPQSIHFSHLLPTLHLVHTHSSCQLTTTPTSLPTHFRINT